MVSPLPISLLFKSIDPRFAYSRETDIPYAEPKEEQLDLLTC